MARPWLAAVATGAGVLVAHPRSAAAQADAGTMMAEAFPYASRGGTAQVRTSLFRVAIAAPVLLGKKTILLPGVAYERFEVGLRSPAGPASLVLHAPALSVMMVHSFGERVTVMASVSSGIASDLKERIRDADVLGSGLVLVLYRLAPSFTIGGGILYDRRTGSLQPAPMVVLNWRWSQNLRLAGVMPALVNLEYRTAPWLSTSLRATLSGNRYQFGETSTSGRLQLAVSSVAVGPSLTLHAGSFLHLDVYAAASVYRRYEVLDRGQRIGDATLPLAVGYGLRLWAGPSGWDSPSAAPR